MCFVEALKAADTTGCRSKRCFYRHEVLTDVEGTLTEMIARGLKEPSELAELRAWFAGYLRRKREADLESELERIE